MNEKYVVNRTVPRLFLFDAATSAVLKQATPNAGEENVTQVVRKTTVLEVLAADNQWAACENNEVVSAFGANRLRCAIF